MSISHYYISTKFTSLTTSVNVVDDLTVAPSLAINTVAAEAVETLAW